MDPKDCLPGAKVIWFKTISGSGTCQKLGAIVLRLAGRTKAHLRLVEDGTEKTRYVRIESLEKDPG